MSYNYITTYTGKSFNFIDPKPEQIDIEDIAQALSMQCRFNGHVKRFYSVAEHCCIMHDYAFNNKGNMSLALDALMHDASEAYICDIPRPVKPHLINYQAIEMRIEAALQRKFKFKPMDAWLKDIDNRIVADEARELFLHVPDWVEDYQVVGVQDEIQYWTPKRAKDEFLERF